MTNNDLRNNIKQIKIEEDDPAKRRKLAEVIVGGKLPTNFIVFALTRAFKMSRENI
jgi:hypothetical protein